MSRRAFSAQRFLLAHAGWFPLTACRLASLAPLFWKTRCSSPLPYCEGAMRRHWFALAVTALALSACTQRPDVKRDRDAYDPETVYLIIHSDDAGMCHSTNAAT